MGENLYHDGKHERSDKQQHNEGNFPRQFAAEDLLTMATNGIPKRRHPTACGADPPGRGGISSATDTLIPGLLRGNSAKWTGIGHEDAYAAFRATASPMACALGRLNGERARWNLALNGFVSLTMLM